jgi:Putative auto-transporter adhesin, head GIN domain
MCTRLLAAAWLAFGLAACQVSIPAASPIVGSGIALTQARDVGAFSAIRVGSAVVADVQIGPTVGLSATADDNLLPNLMTTVSGTRLDVRVEGSVSTKLPMRVTITVPSLDWLQVDSAGQLHVQGLSVAGSLRVNARSGGVIEASGTAESLDLQAAEASQVRLLDLDIGNATVRLETAATASISASQSVTGNVATAATLFVAGRPAIHVATDTTGRVVHD